MLTSEASVPASEGSSLLSVDAVLSVPVDSVEEVLLSLPQPTATEAIIMAASINANTFFIPENPPTFFEKSSFGFAMNLRFVYLHKCEFNCDLLLVSIAVPIQKIYIKFFGLV